MQTDPKSPQHELTSISGEPVHYWIEEADPTRKEKIMRLSSLLLAAVGAVALLVVVLAILGVSFHRPVTLQGAALYDRNAEITVSGVVTEVRDFACPVSDGDLGAHAVLKTKDGDLLVHLAPGRMMRSQNLKFAPGDQLTVVGARARALGNNDLIAREIERGPYEYVLRDPTGKLMLAQ